MTDQASEGRGLRRRLLGYAGVAGIAVASTAVGVAARRRVIARRGAGDAFALGSLRSAPMTVVADDGVPLHVEIDEAEEPTGPLRRRGEPEPLTVVFVHGFALNLDCWHFQRAGYRGLVRTVYYDQRSHGRSGRSKHDRATIEQLGQDLLAVIDHAAPHGRVVLIGHSMGGMSVIALAETHPELFGDRIVGVGLISTTAGGLDAHRIVLPVLPRRVYRGQLNERIVALVARGSRVIDGVRRIGDSVALVATERMAFGGAVPEEYVRFVNQMLASTPFEVIAEFFPNFDALDKFAVVAAFEHVPTSIICGSDDRVTSIGHSRKLHTSIPGSTLVEVQGAGHMVIIERHEQVNAALDQLLAAAADHPFAGAG